MLPMALAGHGRVALMLLLATIVLVEAIRVDGVRLTRAASAALFGSAALIAAGF